MRLRTANNNRRRKLLPLDEYRMLPVIMINASGRVYETLEGIRGGRWVRHTPKKAAGQEAID